MTTLIIDASILIDLRKASALTLLTRLPHELMTTNFVFNELQRFTLEELHKIFPGRLQVSDLATESVQRVSRVTNRGRLSQADASILVLAKTLPNSILLTGDKRIRNISRDHEIEFHGTIWLFREFVRNGIGTNAELCAALEKLKNDKSVWLPSDEISALIAEINDTG